jgi:hypothetical protein
MEGPNDNTNMFAKVGLEAYGDNKAGSCYGFVTVDEYPDILFLHRFQ